MSDDYPRDADGLIDLDKLAAVTDEKLPGYRQALMDALDGLPAVRYGPPDTCSICGVEDDYLTDIRVVVSEDEEGYADITQQVCELHLNAVLDRLRHVGFRDHRHGGIDFLEDESCPGHDDPDDCPTPTYYGPVTRTHDGYWQHPDIVKDNQ